MWKMERAAATISCCYNDLLCHLAPAQQEQCHRQLAALTTAHLETGHDAEYNTLQATLLGQRELLPHMQAEYLRLSAAAHAASAGGFLRRLQVTGRPGSPVDSGAGSRVSTYRPLISR